jgi:uncharacterized protein (DUF2147 family)
MELPYRGFPGCRVQTARPAALLLAAALSWTGGAMAAPAPPTGEWYTPDRTGVVRVGPCGDALCGVIVGLTDWPKDGSVLRDVHGTPQCHLLLLKDLRLHDDGRWHGSVTNPEDGRTYDAEVWLGPDGAMRLRGYIGLEIFGSTQRWPAFHGSIANDCHFVATP